MWVRVEIVALQRRTEADGLRSCDGDGWNALVVFLAGAVALIRRVMVARGTGSATP